MAKIKLFFSQMPNSKVNEQSADSQDKDSFENNKKSTERKDKQPGDIRRDNDKKGWEI